MLEHFGLKDIWVTIKKKRNFIAIIATLFLILFSFNAYGKLKNSAESNEEGKLMYAYSLSYYVQPNISGVNLESKDGEFYRGLPNDYIALLSTDACASYIYNELCKIYSEEYISKNSEFNPKNFKGYPPVQAIKNLYKIKRYKSTMIFNVYGVSYDKNLSESVSNILKEYIENNIEPKVKEATLELSGQAVKTVTSSEELSTDDEVSKSPTSSFSSSKRAVKICIKNIVVPMIGVLTFLIFALAFKSFLNPTMNRKSDFAAYGIPVIGEIKDK